jgi:hypothetical protein
LGITAIALFFLFGAVMSGLTALLLIFPGSAIEPLWRLNHRAREELTAMGTSAVFLMAAVSAACATSAIGLARRTRWGYWAALAVLLVNMVGDILNAFVRHDWPTLIGLPIGAAMLAYLSASILKNRQSLIRNPRRQ